MSLRGNSELNKVRWIHLAIVGAAVFGWALLLSPRGSARIQGRRLDGQNSAKDSASPETRAGVLRAVSTVGLILVRNSGDPADQGPRPRGSGVVVRTDGVVVTNLHVIAQDNSVVPYGELFFNLPDTGMAAQLAVRRYRLKPALINREYDLALLRVF
jgi:S1-C subfamily serine protease